MVNLQDIEKAIQASKPVFLRNFKQDSTHLQGAAIAAKPRVNIPTAKALYGDTRLRGDGESIDWECFGLGSQPVIDVPAWTKELFDEACYTTEYTGNEGVWYAVLFGLDATFITRTASDQERCVLELKQQMSIELDDYYQRLRYRQYGYSKTDMYRALQRADAYHSSLGHYLSDFLDMNLLVLLPAQRYYWVGQPCTARVTLILYNADDITWGSIVHPNHDHHLFADVSFVTGKYTHLSDFDIGATVLTMDDVQVRNIKRELRKMKIKELQEKAMELEINLYDADQKKKLKKMLMEEIFLELTGQTMAGGVGNSGGDSDEVVFDDVA